MSIYTIVQPLDKTIIKTRLKVHPDLFKDPTAFLIDKQTPVRTAKASKGKSKRCPTRNLTINLLDYQGLKVELRNVARDPLTDVTIYFNPGVCLRAHNGGVIYLSGFIDALVILITHLKPLLRDPGDWVDLVPGLRHGGVAYWHYLELSHHASDPDGEIFSCYRHARITRSRTPVRHWEDSMTIKAKNSNLVFHIYRKAAEMVEHGKLHAGALKESSDILRLEARLKENVLIELLGNDRNVEVIGGKERLVRFYPADLVSGLRASFGILRGVFQPDVAVLNQTTKRGQLANLGRLIAKVALDPRTPYTVQELVDYIRIYNEAKTKSELETIRKIREAALMELERLSPLDKLFSSASLNRQPSISNQEKEEKVRHEFVDHFVYPVIKQTYIPEGLPFRPMVEFPKYFPH